MLTTEMLYLAYAIMLGFYRSSHISIIIIKHNMLYTTNQILYINLMICKLFMPNLNFNCHNILWALTVSLAVPPYHVYFTSRLNSQSVGNYMA